ncbi:MAG: hypothetical protein JWQ40_3341 [Segetibacter sp.]|nr:hypothetical protein [Segetibacter sp.]
MNNANNPAIGVGNDDNSSKDEKETTVPNPFDPNDDKQITQEDIENEQKYKEALTERD